MIINILFLLVYNILFFYMFILVTIQNSTNNWFTEKYNHNYVFIVFSLMYSRLKRNISNTRPGITHSEQILNYTCFVIFICCTMVTVLKIDNILLSLL